MENKKGQPTTEAIFRGIQSGKVLELFDKLQYQIAIHGDLTYSDPWGEVHRFRDQFESAKQFFRAQPRLGFTNGDRALSVCRCMDTILRDGSEGLFASTGNVPDGIPFTD